MYTIEDFILMNSIDDDTATALRDVHVDSSFSSYRELIIAVAEILKDK